MGAPSWYLAQASPLGCCVSPTASPGPLFISQAEMLWGSAPAGAGLSRDFPGTSINVRQCQRSSWSSFLSSCLRSYRWCWGSVCELVQQCQCTVQAAQPGLGACAAEPGTCAAIKHSLGKGARPISDPQWGAKGGKRGRLSCPSCCLAPVTGKGDLCRAVICWVGSLLCGQVDGMRWAFPSGSLASRSPPSRCPLRPPRPFPQLLGMGETSWLLS